MVGGTQAIKATVPLSTMFGYATHMRSSTQGRANYSMQFKQYEEAPRSVSEEIIGRKQGRTKIISQSKSTQRILEVQL